MSFGGMHVPRTHARSIHAARPLSMYLCAHPRHALLETYLTVYAVAGAAADAIDTAWSVPVVGMLHWDSPDPMMVGTRMDIRARTRRGATEKEEKEDIGCTKRQRWPRPRRKIQEESLIERRRRRA
jgi:hypothetical protein